MDCYTALSFSDPSFPFFPSQKGNSCEKTKRFKLSPRTTRSFAVPRTHIGAYSFVSTQFTGNASEKRNGNKSNGKRWALVMSSLPFPPGIFNAKEWTQGGVCVRLVADVVALFEILFSLSARSSCLYHGVWTRMEQEWIGFLGGFPFRVLLEVMGFVAYFIQLMDPLSQPVTSAPAARTRRRKSTHFLSMRSPGRRTGIPGG